MSQIIRKKNAQKFSKFPPDAAKQIIRYSVLANMENTLKIRSRLEIWPICRVSRLFFGNWVKHETPAFQLLRDYWLKIRIYCLWTSALKPWIFDVAVCAKVVFSVQQFNFLSQIYWNYLTRFFRVHVENINWAQFFRQINYKHSALNV